VARIPEEGEHQPHLVAQEDASSSRARDFSIPAAASLLVPPTRNEVGGSLLRAAIFAAAAAADGGFGGAASSLATAHHREFVRRSLEGTEFRKQRIEVA
jgi:hypothetical protein